MIKIILILIFTFCYEVLFSYSLDFYKKNSNISYDEEIINKRTWNSKHFRQKDGKIVAIFSADRLHYKKNNKWEDIDLQIVQLNNKNGYDFGCENNSLKIYFSESVNSKYPISVNTASNKFLLGKSNISVRDALNLNKTDNSLSYDNYSVKFKANKAICENLFSGIKETYYITPGRLTRKIVLSALDDFSIKNNSINISHEFQCPEGSIFTVNNKTLNGDFEIKTKNSAYIKNILNEDKSIKINAPFLLLDNRLSKTKKLTYSLQKEGNNIKINFQLDYDLIKSANDSIVINSPLSEDFYNLAAADAYVDSYLDERNFGGSTLLMAGNYIDEFDNAGTNYSYLYFDLSSITKTNNYELYILEKAELELYYLGVVDDAIGQNKKIDGCPVLYNQSLFSEDFITWKNKPTPDFSYPCSNSSENPQATDENKDCIWELKHNYGSYLSDIMNDKTSNKGIVLVPNINEGDNNIKVFCSRENTDPSQPPFIIIKYTLKRNIRGDIAFLDEYYRNANDEKLMNTADYILVQVYNKDTGIKLGEDYTAFGGFTDIWIDDCNNIAIKIVCRCKDNENRIATIWKEGEENTIFKSDYIEEPIGNETGVFYGVNFNPEEGSDDKKNTTRCLQMLKMIYQEYNYVKDAVGWNRNEINVVFNPDKAEAARYDVDEDKIYIYGKLKVYYQAPWHEYGHAIMRVFFKGYGTDIKSHKVYTIAKDMIFPWTEGWAIFMDDWTRYQEYRTIKGYTQDFLHPNTNIENNDWWQGSKPEDPGDPTNTNEIIGDNENGELVEGAVASFLWDLDDYNDDSEDNDADPEIYEQFATIFNIMSSHHSENNPIQDVHDFIRYWKKHHEDSYDKVHDIACAHRLIHDEGCEDNGGSDIKVYEKSVLPQSYDVTLNYPNPFNPVTSVKYQMPEAGIVNIDIFNSLGQKINTLVNCRQAAGYYTVLWDGKNNQGKQVASGIYFICFHINQFYDTKKVMLMK